MYMYIAERPLVKWDQYYRPEPCIVRPPGFKYNRHLSASTIIMLGMIQQSFGYIRDWCLIIVLYLHIMLYMKESTKKKTYKEKKCTTRIRQLKLPMSMFTWQWCTKKGLPLKKQMHIDDSSCIPNDILIDYILMQLYTQPCSVWA